MRPDKDTYFIQIAKLIAARSTCRRRSVGSVLVNRNGHILATGYNGVASGLPHCNDAVSKVFKGGIEIPTYPHACQGARLPSGEGLDKCEAIHAEQNALLQCSDVYKIETVYCTTAPCITCTKLLMQTSAERIVFIENYPHAEVARNLWVRQAGKTWIQHQ